tara:strand:- start:45 stop:578 length:534 start_codon:yes stop_codon:yes gene_type:complete
MHYYPQTKYYFIDKYDTKNIENVDQQTIVIFRNYSLGKENKTLLLKLKKYCAQRKIRFYLSNNIKLAIELNLDGAYIPSFNKDFSHLNYSFKKKFELIGSAHNIKEIKVKEIQKVKRIFLSSLFKKNKNYLGLNKFKLLSEFTKVKVVALGGISKKNLKKLKLVKYYEFAGISYFKE